VALEDQSSQIAMVEKHDPVRRDWSAWCATP